MRKALLAISAAALLFGTCFYVSTEVGLQTKGWHDVVVETAGRPAYAAVGHSYFTPDGSKVLVTAVTRAKGGKHRIHARVEGTHRYALALFPTRWEHSFSMDRPSLEWTLRQAGGQASGPLETMPGRRWHPVN